MPLAGDPPLMPGTGESPEERLARSLPPAGTAAEDYLARRGIPLAVAEAAGVRYDPHFAGRPALLAALRGPAGEVAALHGRYLVKTPRQDKMLTFGPGKGVLEVLGGWRGDPVILVEGLFDALSLAVCGWSSTATLGRWAPWLPGVLSGRPVWIGFDNGRPGEAEAQRYAERLPGIPLRRLPPPDRCKDWNTALLKLGAERVRRWVARGLTEG